MGHAALSWMCSASRVGAQPDGLGAGAVPEHADHARLREPGMHLDAERAQLVGDIRTRGRLLERSFRMRVRWWRHVFISGASAVTSGTSFMGTPARDRRWRRQAAMVAQRTPRCPGVECASPRSLVRSCPPMPPLSTYSSSAPASMVRASPATRPAAPRGAPRRTGRHRVRDLAVEHQADPRGLRYLEYYEFRLVRESLSEARSCCIRRRTRPAAAVRAAARAAPAAGVDDPRRSVHVRPTCRGA